MLYHRIQLSLYKQSKILKLHMCVCVYPKMLRVDVFEQRSYKRFFFLYIIHTGILRVWIALMTRKCG